MRTHSCIILMITGMACASGGCTHDDAKKTGDECPKAQYVMKLGAQCTDDSCEFDVIKKYNACPESYAVCAVDAEGKSYCHEKCNITDGFCGGKCIDPLTSDMYCGADAACTSFKKCAPNEKCISGSCTSICSDKQVSCDGTCIDPKTSSQFCGADAACGSYTKCDVDQVCDNCVCDCTTTGAVMCNGKCIDPRSSKEFCGANAGCAEDTYQVCGENQYCNNSQCCLEFIDEGIAA